MATRKPTSEDLARVEDLAKRWGKRVVQEQWGSDGPGLDVNLDQMEEVAMAAVRGTSRPVCCGSDSAGCGWGT